MEGHRIFNIRTIRYKRNRRKRYQDSKGLRIVYKINGRYTEKEIVMEKYGKIKREAVGSTHTLEKHNLSVCLELQRGQVF